MQLRLLFVIALISGLCCTDGVCQHAEVRQEQHTPKPHADPVNKDASFIFTSVRPILDQNSGVPPMLPHFLPYVDERHPIYVITKSIGPSGYDLLLVVELPCDGENRCLYGSVRGSRKAFDHRFNKVSPKSVKVTLDGGVKGRFIDSQCAAYCSESYVEWEKGGYYYSLGLKPGTRKQLIQAANSAMKRQDPGKQIRGELAHRFHDPECPTLNAPPLTVRVGTTKSLPDSIQLQADAVE